MELFFKCANTSQMFLNLLKVDDVFLLSLKTKFFAVILSYFESH